MSGRENERLRTALARAREDMESWGAYADQYFRDKWDLDADLAAVDAALAGPDSQTGAE